MRWFRHPLEAFGNWVVNQLLRFQAYIMNGMNRD